MIVYEELILWKKPDDMGTFESGRIQECCLEALPLTVLQTYVMAMEADYNWIKLCD